VTAPTPAERRLVWLLRGYTALFLVAAVLYLLLPNTALGIANAVGAWFALPPIPLSTERFWLVLAFSMLVVLAFLCWEAQKDVHRGRALVVAVLVCKASSTVCYLALFALEHQLAYLLGGLTDGALLAAGYVLLRAVAPARSVA
jgi:hypothetical protein